MITLLTGENSFEIDRALDKIVSDFDGVAEKIDGSVVELRQLPDLLMGATLFADKRLVIIKDLSENKTVWADFGDWLPRISDDVQFVLVEAKPDKRTRTYKELQKAAKVQMFAIWGDRDYGLAEKWVIDEAKSAGFDLGKKSAQTLVARIGMDQWGLYQALQKLAVLETVTPENIAEFIDARPSENVFNLFEAALRGDARQVSDMIRTLELTEDPYMLFGLLSGQAFQLAALAVSDEPQAVVAKDIGAHPFALGKLANHANKLGRPGVKKVITAFAEADQAMKSSGGEPWLLIERALIKISV
mgnify:CR=1 FL=1